MTTAKEQLKTDLRKDPEDLEREADNARADLEGTVDELMQQLSPGELLNQGMSLFRNKGDHAFVRNFSSQVQNNPIPAVLAGVSLVWLMSASKQPPLHRTEGATGSVGAKTGAAREKLSSATGNLKNSSREAAERTREAGHQVAAGAGNVMHKVSEGSQHTADSVRSGIRSTREGYSRMLREQPLLVGVLAVAAGAALGSLLPRTSAEDRVAGRLSDRETGALKEKAEQKLQEQQGKAAPESAATSFSETRGSASSRAAAASSPGSSGESPSGGVASSHSGRQTSQTDSASSGVGRDAVRTYPGSNP